MKPCTVFKQIHNFYKTETNFPNMLVNCYCITRHNTPENYSRSRSPMPEPQTLLSACSQTKLCVSLSHVIHGESLKCSHNLQAPTFVRNVTLYLKKGGGAIICLNWNQKMCTSLYTAEQLLHIIKILTAAPMFLSYY
jgi:hypothetical protein